jgi:hypothetical protein
MTVMKMPGLAGNTATFTDVLAAPTDTFTGTLEPGVVSHGTCTVACPPFALPTV